MEEGRSDFTLVLVVFIPFLLFFYTQGWFLYHSKRIKAWFKKKMEYNRIYCSKCDSKIKEGAVFCPECGIKLFKIN